MRLKKLILFTGLVLSPWLGFAAAEEECSNTCVYKHAYLANQAFDFKHNVCDIADCFPIPEHSHKGPGFIFGIKATNPAGSDRAPQSLAAENRHGANAESLATAQANHHSHEDGHGHSEHSHYGSHSEADHHHNDSLHDQPVVLIDSRRGESYLYVPTIAEQGKQSLAKEGVPLPVDFIGLESAHIVVYCETGERCDVN